MAPSTDSIVLCLMRHAKSGWDDPSLTDHDRPLNRRGRHDAPRMANWLAETGYLPEVILASTATRVRETVDGLLSVWTHQPLVLYSEALYMATPSTLREHIRCDAITADGRRPKVAMVIAHNPGIGYLVSELTGRESGMPTAAISVVQCEPLAADDLEGPRPRRVIAFQRPKDLPGHEVLRGRNQPPSDS